MEYSNGVYMKSAAEAADEEKNDVGVERQTLTISSKWFRLTSSCFQLYIVSGAMNVMTKLQNKLLLTLT